MGLILDRKFKGNFSKRPKLRKLIPPREIVNANKETVTNPSLKEIFVFGRFVSLLCRDML